MFHVGTSIAIEVPTPKAFAVRFTHYDPNFLSVQPAGTSLAKAPAAHHRGWSRRSLGL